MDDDEEQSFEQCLYGLIPKWLRDTPFNRVCGGFDSPSGHHVLVG
jgi:hypothetical protein